MSLVGTAPEQGQLVRLRNRYFIAEDVIPHDTGHAVRAIMIPRVNLLIENYTDSDRTIEGK